MKLATFRYLLKRGRTWNDLKRSETTWNDLQRARTIWNSLQQTRNDLKRPTTSKKRPETTYNEQEMTWNDLERARNDLKGPRMSKKQPEMTWNNLQWARNDVLFTYFLNWFRTHSIWYFSWVLPLKAHLRVTEAMSQWEHVEISVWISAAPVLI